MIGFVFQLVLVMTILENHGLSKEVAVLTAKSDSPRQKLYSTSYKGLGREYVGNMIKVSLSLFEMCLTGLL